MSTISTTAFEEALRDWLGNRVVFRDGWETRTSAGGFDAHGVLHHWTAMSGRTVSAAAQERLLAIGRPDLDGPLCHLSPRRSGLVAVICGPHANANHAGNGDADVWERVLAGCFDGTPAPRTDSVDGNERLYGFEYQYHPADGPMPDEQIEAGILAAAALAQAHGWSPAGAAGSNLDHYEWTARKPDRNVHDLAARTRAGVRDALTARTIQEDDMPYTDWPKKDRDALVADVAAAVLAAKVTNRAADGHDQGQVSVSSILTNLERSQDLRFQQLREEIRSLTLAATPTPKEK